LAITWWVATRLEETVMGMKGSKHSEETKQKQRLAHLGKKYKPMSTEGRENIRKAHLGLTLSTESRKKLSEVLKAKNMKRSDEAKKHLSEIHKGERNPQWRGGVTPLHEILRKSPAFRQWRKAVFERDNYTCVLCDKRGGRLHPDHIKPFCGHAELRFVLENGRTLCFECHIQTPTWGLNRKHYFSEDSIQPRKQQIWK